MQTIRVMPATAIALVALVGFLAHAQAPSPPDTPAPAAPEGPTAAEQFLDVAIVKLRAMERVAATISQDVDMLNQVFQLKGEYYKDTGHRVRLKLDLAGLGDTDATMLQISDGKVLWDYQKVLSAPSYRKRDLVPILERLKNPNLDPAFRDLIIANLGFGGPESLLTGFRMKASLNQIEHTQQNGRAVVIIRGTWKDRTGLVSGSNLPISPTAPLPPYVPSNVELTIGEADFWPYKIRMYGNVVNDLLLEDNRPIGQDGRRIGVKRPPPKIKPSTIILEYNLLSSTQIDPALFAFQAPIDSANPPVDDTEQFLGILDQAIMVETERKKADAAKQEAEPTLKESITAPRPDGNDPGLGILPKPKSEPPK